MNVLIIMHNGFFLHNSIIYMHSLLYLKIKKILVHHTDLQLVTVKRQGLTKKNFKKKKKKKPNQHPYNLSPSRK